MTDEGKPTPGGEPDEQARIRQERLRALRQKLRTEPPVVGQNAGGSATGAAETGEAGGALPRFAEVLRARRANQGDQPRARGQGAGGGELLKRLAGLRQNGPAGTGAAGGGGGDLLKRLAAFRQKEGAGVGGAAGGGNRGALLQALRESRSGAAANGQHPQAGGQAGERFPRLRERLLARGGLQAGGDTAPGSARLEQDVRRLEEKVRELEAELREARAEAAPGSKDVND